MKSSVEFFYSIIQSVACPNFGFNSDGTVWFEGVLSLDYDGYPNPWKAFTKFSIQDDWIEIPPNVECHNRWLKREIDWHVPRGDKLCWVYPPQWSNRLRELLDARGKVAARELAAAWMLRNVRHLLTCHLIAKEYQIKEWPINWPQYSHDGKAESEYTRDERKRRERIKKSDGTIFIG